MKTTIQQKLAEIEMQHGIKILYSCESGSRAWGFPSPDSDYDVRFIYTKSMDSYLSIRNEKDFMDFPLSDELDINGWDVKKTLELISKSNSVPFEWLQSPIVYHESTNFADELWTLCSFYFCPRTNIHHYLGIARGAMQTMQEEDIKIKKLFYVLRPMLAALWCAKQNTIAPMSIFPLMDLLTDDLRKKILSLIELKSTANESYLIKIDQDIKTWIDQTFDYCMETSQKMERKSFEIKGADEFFRKMIRI